MEITGFCREAISFSEELPTTLHGDGRWVKTYQNYIYIIFYNLYLGDSWGVNIHNSWEMNMDERP